LKAYGRGSRVKAIFEVLIFVFCSIAIYSILPKARDKFVVKSTIVSGAKLKI